MIANGIIDKGLKILISTNCESDAIVNDKLDFVTPDESNPETPQKAPGQNQINAPVIENTPVINSHTRDTQPPYKFR